MRNIDFVIWKIIWEQFGKVFLVCTHKSTLFCVFRVIRCVETDPPFVFLSDLLGIGLTCNERVRT